MSKAVLISIRPKWCELIATGDKTVEVRKTRPKLETPFRCYIYCTKTEDMLWVLNMTSRADYGGLPAVCANLKHAKGASRGNGKVIGEFTCDFIEYLNNLFVGEPDYHMPEYGNACLELKDLENYGKGKRLYGWHISDLVIYDEPKELSEFSGLRQTKFGLEPVSFTRAPQSWCYVEDLGDKIANKEET